MIEILIISILFVYLVVGILPSNVFSQRNGFLIANRNLTSFSSGFSIFASKIGGGLFVTYSALFFVYGYSSVMFFVGAVFGYFTFYFLIRKPAVEIKEKDDIYSLSDIFKYRFGKNIAFVVGLLISISMFGWVVTNLTIGSKIIGKMTGWNEIFILVSISTIICTYLLYGGFYSVIRTDFIQTIMIITIFIIVLVFLYSNNNGVLFSTSNRDSIGVVNIVSFFLLGFLFPIGSAELYQRIIACKGVREVKQSLLVSACLYLLAGFVLTAICGTVLNIGFFGDINADLKLSVGMSDYLLTINPILSTIWVIAFVSMVISSADTFIYSSSSSLIQDVMNNREYTEEKRQQKILEKH